MKRPSRPPLIVTLFLVLSLALPSVLPAADVLRAGPYLLFATRQEGSATVIDATAMTVRWQTNGPLPDGACTIEWGATEAYGRSRPVTCPDNRCVHTIQGLTPGQMAFYRVKCLEAQYTGSFRAPPAPGATSLTFFAYGDSRGDEVNAIASGQRHVLARLKQEIERDPGKPYTLCVHSGDFVHHGQKPQEWDTDASGLHNEFFVRKQPNMWFLANIPIAGTLGNHEGYAEFRVTDYANFGQVFRGYWPYGFYPADPQAFYYSFDYGPAHFAVIDVNDRVGGNAETGLNTTVAGLSPGTRQFDWLAADLDSSKPWKIVIMHNPVYTASPPRERFKANPQLARNLHDLFKQKGVRVVIQGHNHYYARRVMDGITYLTLGGGGAPMYNPIAVGPHEKAVKILHFARFDISGKTLTLQVIDDSGNTVETRAIHLQ